MRGKKMLHYAEIDLQFLGVHGCEQVPLGVP